MQTPDNNSAKQDPKTSTSSTDDSNSGESVPQTGENVLNEQEQNKSVNQEEFVEDAAQNTHDANTSNDDGSLPVNSIINKEEGLNRKLPASAMD